MKKYIFATKDLGAQAFMTPFFMEHSGIALRGFTDAVNNPNGNTDIYNHPDDFELYDLGFFDPETGVLVSHPPKLISQGKHCKIRN